MQQKTEKIFNLIFVVCHPDDEAVWVGGLLSELSRFNFLKIYVICLSGGTSERLQEFKKAQEIAGYFQSFLSDERLRLANNPIVDISKTVEKGIINFGLKFGDVDLIVTHPPFGDEHGHPHHKQTYNELYAWTRNNHIPFGYFSTAVVPFFDLRPTLQNMKRSETLHILQVSDCINNLSLLKKIFSRSLRPYHTPKYYIQFLSDKEKKIKMLQCYNSVDLEKFKKGYCSYTQNSESIYIIDKAGFIPFEAVLASMETPGRKYLFPPQKNLFGKIFNSKK